MASDEFPIDNPDDGIPPANPARRRVATLTGCLFLIVVLGFIVWFIAENSDPPEERPSLFGLSTQIDPATVSPPDPAARSFPSPFRRHEVYL